VSNLTWCQIMDKLTPPEPLSLEWKIADNWTRWKQHYEIFFLASSLSRKDAKIQAATFLHVAGADTLEVYSTFSWEDVEDKLKVYKIMEKFNSYCIPLKNVTWVRHVFNTCNQHAGETIDQYVTDLQTKARTYEFTEVKDSLIRDRIVWGITRGLLWLRWLYTYPKPSARLNCFLSVILIASYHSWRVSELVTPQLNMMYIKFKSDKQVNCVVTLVTNVVYSIANTKHVQHKAQNATTVVDETILPESVELQKSNTLRSILLNTSFQIPPMICLLAWSTQTIPTRQTG